MSAKDFIIRLAHQLQDEESAVFDLWSWLPSEVLGKEAHGDYALEFRKQNSDIVREASVVFSYLRGYCDLRDTSERSLLGCGCEDCEVPTRERLVEILDKYILPPLADE